MRHRILVAALLSALMMLVSPAALACVRPHTQEVTRVSDQEGCALSVTVWYRTDGRGVTVQRVLADGLQGFTPALAVIDQQGRLLYSGPNSYGHVGDGADYLYVKGYEQTADDRRVPIGASTSNPRGWAASGYTGKSLTISVAAPEFRYCGVRIELSA